MKDVIVALLILIALVGTYCAKRSAVLEHAGQVADHNLHIAGEQIAEDAKRASEAMHRDLVKAESKAEEAGENVRAVTK